MTSVIDELRKKIDKYFKVDLNNLSDLKFYLQPNNPQGIRTLLKPEDVVKSIKGLVNWSNVKIEASNMA